ncbi:MAG TPA: hypothetical protein VH436_09430 [Vicinamibacterales bacterium]
MTLSRRTALMLLALAGGLLLLWVVRYLGSTASIEIVEAEYGVPGVDYKCGDTAKRASASDGGGVVLACP